MDDEWRRRARSFGQVAQRYERWRPGYPDALYEHVLQLTEDRRVLEAGAGTGRATVELARRGASVVAVEPDADMAAVARRRTADLPVEVRESTFEDFPAPLARFDLVVCAQAWHWIDPERGAAVAARALRPSGALCLWWNRPRELAGPVWDAIHDAYAEHAPHLDRRDQLRRQPRTESEAPPAPGFTPWWTRTFDWEAHYGAESYTGLLGTQSDHLQLPAPQRTRLLDAVAAVIREVGRGGLEYRFRTLLLHARPR